MGQSQIYMDGTTPSSWLQRYEIWSRLTVILGELECVSAQDFGPMTTFGLLHSPRHGHLSLAGFVAGILAEYTP